MTNLLNKVKVLFCFGLCFFPFQGWSEAGQPIPLMPPDAIASTAEAEDLFGKSSSLEQSKEIKPRVNYIHNGLDKIKFPLESRILNSLLINLVLERINKEDPVYLTGQKLKLLFKLGRFNSLIRLLSTIPDQERSSTLMEGVFIAMCFQETLNPKVINGVAIRYHQVNPSQFWRQAAALSEVLLKEKAKAELALNLMRDIKKYGDSQFLKLMDNLLYDAKIKGFTRPTLIELAVARAGEITIPEKVLMNKNLTFQVAVLLSDNLPLMARIIAAEQALERGVIDAKVLQILYSQVKFKDHQILNVQKKQGLLEKNRPPSEKRALLYQAAKRSAGLRRAELLQSFWNQDQGISSEALFEVSHNLLTDLIPDEDLTWFAPKAFKALSLFNDERLLKVWASFSQQESPELWLELSPLIYLRSLESDQSIDEWFTQWYSVKSTQDPLQAKNKALLLVNLLVALGKPLQKATLKELKIAFMNEAHPGIVQNLFIKPLEDRTLEEILVSAGKKMQKGTKKKDWIRLAQVIGRLKQFGFEQEARRLAVEIALKNAI